MMTETEIKKLSPQERVAGYVRCYAQLAEVGCRLRVRHAHEATNYDEKWTEAEDNEWDKVADEADIWFYALSVEEKQAVAKVMDVLGQLTRGEWPLKDGP